jgi:hypothetical protein
LSVGEDVIQAALDALWPAHALVFAGLAALVFLPLEHVFPARPDQRRATWAADLLFATAGAWLARAGTIVGVGAALAALDCLAPDEALFAGVRDARMRTGLDIACGLPCSSSPATVITDSRTRCRGSGACTGFIIRRCRSTGWHRFGSIRWRSCS